MLFPGFRDHQDKCTKQRGELKHTISTVKEMYNVYNSNNNGGNNNNNRFV